MTKSTRRARRLALALAALGLLGASGQAHSQDQAGFQVMGFSRLPKLNWIQHGKDAAIEGGKLTTEQVTDDETLAMAAKAADTVVDTAAAATGTGAAIAVLSKSGPAILSTLKAAGGPVAAGSSAGFGVAGLQEKYLYNNCDQQKACDVAGVSGYVGAVAGTAGSMALGASFGVGASGLAGIGALVGGGMAAGAVTLIALPAATAVAVAGGAYLATNWIMN